MVAFDPAARYRDMDALAEDLRRFLGGEPVAANPSARRALRAGMPAERLEAVRALLALPGDEADSTRAIALLRGQGEAPLARQASERLFAILELLFHNPEVSDSERERLLDLQLRRLARLRADGRVQAAETLRARIRQELEIYHQGPRRDAFLRALGP